MKRKTFKKFVVAEIVIAVLLVISIVLTIVANSFATNINVALQAQTFKQVGGDEDQDTIYYKSAYTNYEDLKKWEKQVAVMMEEEGAVLLKNENNTLPLSSGGKVNFLGYSSVDIMRCGTGSGSVGVDSNANVATLKSGFEQAGLDVNDDLWDYVSGLTSSASRQVYEIVEPTIDLDTVKEKIGTEYKSGAAVLTLSRTGGEGDDLFMAEAGDGSSKGYDVLKLSDSELALLDNIKTLKDSGYFSDGVVLVLNTANTIQLDFLKNTKYADLFDAVVWIGYVGYWGPDGVGNLFAGEANFSGSLVDSMYYDNHGIPSSENFGVDEYSDYSVLDSSYQSSNSYNYVTYAEGIYVGYKYYETRYEDVVLGTANVGDFSYEDLVAYPFGAGLSYTTFEYSDISMKENIASSGNPAEDTFEITVTVTNTGKVAGKHAVQVFAQSPYTQYDKDNKIEKASVQYCGFEKTSLLQPGASETLTITVNKEEIASYDAYGEKTYILDNGNYYFGLANDSHEALNNILLKKAEQENISINTSKMVGSGNKNNALVWENDSQSTGHSKLDKAYKTGVTVTNQFDHADPTLSDVGGASDFEFLSRSDWVGTYPKGVATTTTAKKHTTTYYSSTNFSVTTTMKNNGLEWNSNSDADDVFYNKLLANWDGIELSDGTTLSKDTQLTFGAVQVYSLADGIGKSLDDSFWDKLVDQLSFQECVKLIANGSHATPEMESVGKPYTYDENGPVGLSRSATAEYPEGLTDANEYYDKSDVNAYRYGVPSNDVSASTCNRELIYLEGQAIGENAVWNGTSGIYGPGSNIHRSPYSGRNFEYVSEDGYITGVQVDYISRGMNSRGLYTYQKHALLNDQEAGRRGIGVWTNEQAIREIYIKGQRDSFRNADQYIVDDTKNEDGTLKSFEFETGLNWGVGIMSSYNRLGTIWSGHDYNLQINVYRNEFGGTGMFLTDNNGTTQYTHINGGVLGGTTNWDNKGAETLLDWAQDDGRMQYAVKYACKHILYTVANSLGMNGVKKGAQIVAVTPAWQVALIVVDCVFGALTVGGAAFLIIVKIRSKKKK